MTTATRYEGLIPLGQAETPGFACAAHFGATEKSMKKQHYIGGMARVRNGRFFKDQVLVDFRQARTAPVTTISLTKGEVARLIAALADAMTRTEG